MPRKFAWCSHNLNTHTGASLYEAFPPAEARRLLEHLEFHHMPKHGSWLPLKENTAAEIEIGVMNGQCLNRRIPEQQIISKEVAAWEQQRNKEEAKIRSHVHRIRCTRKTGKNLPVN